MVLDSVCNQLTIYSKQPANIRQDTNAIWEKLIKLKRWSKYALKLAKENVFEVIFHFPMACKSLYNLSIIRAKIISRYVKWLTNPFLYILSFLLCTYILQKN